MAVVFAGSGGEGLQGSGNTDTDSTALAFSRNYAGLSNP
jgi:hypothetical protein